MTCDVLAPQTRQMQEETEPNESTTQHGDDASTYAIDKLNVVVLSIGSCNVEACTTQENERGGCNDTGRTDTCDADITGKHKSSSIGKAEHSLYAHKRSANIARNNAQFVLAGPDVSEMLE